MAGQRGHKQSVGVTVPMWADWWIRELLAGVRMLEDKSRFLGNPKTDSWTGLRS